MEGGDFEVVSAEIYFVDFAWVVGHFGVCLPCLCSVFPGLFPESVPGGFSCVLFLGGRGRWNVPVDDFHVFFCGEIALVVWHYFFLTHGLCSRITMTGNDIPSHASIRQMIQRRIRPCQNIGCYK